MRTIVSRRKTQTRSCGRNLRMRPERGDTETRGPRGLGKGDVRGVVEAVLGEHLPKPTRREEVTLRRGSKLEVAQDTVYIYRPGCSWIRSWRWCRRRHQRSCWGGIYVHPERKEFCTRYGRAQEAFRTRAKPRGRPVTSDRPPPRRCGQAAWAAAGRAHFFYMGGYLPTSICLILGLFSLPTCLLSGVSL
jgi:hypothetical protein